MIYVEHTLKIPDRQNFWSDNKLQNMHRISKTTPHSTSLSEGLLLIQHTDRVN